MRSIASLLCLIIFLPLFIIPASSADLSEVSKVKTVDDFGAVGNGLSCEDNAMEAYSTYFRSQLERPNASRVWRLGSGRNYRICQPVNLTQLSHIVIDLNGSRIFDDEGGIYAVLDLLGSTNFRIIGNGYINCGSQQSPCINGVQIGRIADGTTISESNISNIDIDGFFTQAALFNHGTEAFGMSWPHLRNRFHGAAWSYAIIQDGTNHWPLFSKFVSTSELHDTYSSFTGQTILQPIMYTAGGPAVWMSGVGGQHHWLGGYAQVSGLEEFPVVVLYVAGAGSPSSAVVDLDWRVHSEINPKSIFEFIGNKDANVVGLEISDYLIQSKFVFSTDDIVKSISISMISARIPSFLNKSARVFDNPNNYRVDGDFYILHNYKSSWNSPNVFSGSFISDGEGFSFGRGSVQLTQPQGILSYRDGILLNNR